MLEVIVLSVLQGIAEFLPISSSGHLVLGRSVLGLGDVGLRLDIFLHVGTLVSIFAFYGAIVARLVRNAFGAGGSDAMRESWMYALKIVVSAVPAGIVGVLFKDDLESIFSSTKAVGGALLFTGVVLIATKFLPRGKGEVSFFRAVCMGVAQAVAILPGVSRSGMTLAAARASGVEAGKSAEFSFLMSAPPIVGAALLEIAKAFRAAEPATPDVSAAVEVSWLLCACGAVIAAVVGYFALALLLKSLKSDKFWLFGPYCLLAGAIVLFCA